MNSPITTTRPPVPSPPGSVRIVGWSLLIAAAVSMLLNIGNLLLPNELESGLRMLRQGAQFPDSTIERSFDRLIAFNRILAGAELLYFLVVAMATVGLLRFREWGRKTLETCCWVGLGLGAGESVLSYAIWREMQLSLEGLLRSIGAGQHSITTPLGTAAILLGLLLWVVPTVGIGLYLRRPGIRALMT